MAVVTTEFAVISCIMVRCAFYALRLCRVTAREAFAAWKDPPTARRYKLKVRCAGGEGMAQQGCPLSSNHGRRLLYGKQDLCGVRESGAPFPATSSCALCPHPLRLAGRLACPAAVQVHTAAAVLAAVHAAGHEPRQLP